MTIGHARACPVCGYSQDARKKPRSYEQHKRFWSLMDKAFTHWPDGNDFRPETAEHLRKFLICAAGPEFRKSFSMPVPKEYRNEKVAQFVVSMQEQVQAVCGDYAFPRLDLQRWTCAVYVAKSISYSEMPHLQFNALSAAVDEVIKAEMGLDPDQLLKDGDQA